MIEHAVKAQLAELRTVSEAREARLKAARERERRARGNGSMGAFRINGKRAKISSNDAGSASSDQGDEQYLPEDRDGATTDGDGVYLSKEVRDLMAK